MHYHTVAAYFLGCFNETTIHVVLFDIYVGARRAWSVDCGDAFHNVLDVSGMIQKPKGLL